MIQTDQKYSYRARSTLYRPRSTLYRPGSTLYSPWGFPDGPRNTLSGSRSTLYCPGSTLEVGVGFLWLDGEGFGSFTSLTNLMRGVYKRRALAPCYSFNRIKNSKHCSISFLKRVICLNSKPVWFLSFVGYIRKIKRYIITECAKNILLYYYTPIANCLFWCHLFISNRLNQRTSTPMRIYCHPLESSVWP